MDKMVFLIWNCGKTPSILFVMSFWCGCCVCWCVSPKRNRNQMFRISFSSLSTFCVGYSPIIISQPEVYFSSFSQNYFLLWFYAKRLSSLPEGLIKSSWMYAFLSVFEIKNSLGSGHIRLAIIITIFSAYEIYFRPFNVFVCVCLRSSNQHNHGGISEWRKSKQEQNCKNHFQRLDTQ